MALTLEQRLSALEGQMRVVQGVTAAVQGQPASALISIPHNDSWLFEDNLDATHPGNLRYVIASNVQRVVTARLSIHLAPYRTYNSLSLTSTGNESATHNHASAGHNHEMFGVVGGSAGTTANTITLASTNQYTLQSSGTLIATENTFSTTPGATGTESATHNHTVSGTATLGVTEGATATGITISFDGVDKTAALGGPFNADQIELNVLPYLPTSQGAFHVIALQPSGLGRIEAHLRLGVYVAAGSDF